MKDLLFIRLFEDGQSIDWGILDGEQSSPSFIERGSLLIQDVIALAELSADKDVCLVIPTSKVRSFLIETPTKNRKHLEKAVPFLLEEQLAENIESQHFALGDFNSEGKLAVNVINKSYLEGLLSAFNQAEVALDLMVTEASCLPSFDDAWSILDDEQIIVRESDNQAWSSDKDMAQDMLQWNLQQKIDQEQLVSQAVRLYSESDEPFSFSGVAGLAVQNTQIEDSLLWLASQDKGQAINLLQQGYSSVKKSNVNIGHWKPALIAASVLLVTGVLYLGSNIYTKSSQISELKEQILASSEKVIDNPIDAEDAIYKIDQAYARVGNSVATGTSFSGLFDKTMSQINHKQLHLTQLNYSTAKSELSFDINAKNYQALTQLQEKLEKSGLEADMKNAAERNSIWSTRMIVKVK